ncbi:MAG: legionaminic acid biosynthesis protein PtmG, partial [Zetaproteobacteria bacterium CG23_combo_of_CG06-09_8_20_14_all_59_86]
DERGWCNACQWMEEKKTLDWGKRQDQLAELISRHKGRGQYDCLVAVSGGKDGSYVAHTLKTRYGLKPLCITVRPPLSLDIGEANLNAFINSGFEHLLVSPDTTVMRELDKIGFLHYGQGYYGWLISIHTAVLRIAEKFGISLVFYSEDGEVEYGGSTEKRYEGVYGIDYMRKVYLNETYDTVMRVANVDDRDLYWFRFPEEMANSLADIEVTHFSFYENWDPYRNYLVAKEHCGLAENEEAVVGTFTNFAQNDQLLASLHYYLMYLKFGFGRATQDAGIEIRRGSMSRAQAINLVNLYDSQAPLDNYQAYADYFDISLEEFENTVDKFANKELFEKVDGSWRPKFVVS